MRRREREGNALSRSRRSALIAALLPLLAASTDPALTARIQMEMLGSALEAYRADVGAYPSTEEGLAALLEPPPRFIGDPRHRRGGYILSVPKDFWGHAYVYRFPGERNPGQFELLSLGADGRAGGSGFDADLTSWSDAGYEEHSRQRWEKNRGPRATLGAVSAFVLGMPFCVAGVVRRRRAGASWIHSAFGRPTALPIAAAGLGFLAGFVL